MYMFRYVKCKSKDIIIKFKGMMTKFKSIIIKRKINLYLTRKGLFFLWGLKIYSIIHFLN